MRLNLLTIGAIIGLVTQTNAATLITSTTSTLSHINEFTDGPSSGATSAFDPSRGGTVDATPLSPTTTLSDPDFLVCGGSPTPILSADTSPASGSSNGGGGRDVSGSFSLTEVVFTLAAGESVDYTFDMAYTLVGASGADQPEASWSLTNNTTASSIFSGSTTSSGTTGPLTGTITGAATYTLQLQVEITDGSMPNNSTADASITSFCFNADSDLIPEPSSALLSVTGILLLGLRRRRQRT